VLNCKRAVTTEYALLFEAALGIEAGMWIDTGRLQYANSKTKQIFCRPPCQNKQNGGSVLNVIIFLIILKTHIKYGNIRN